MNLQLKPHKIYLTLAIVFGILMIICTPPFRVPDEINHFYRAWQVSSGEFSSVKDNQRLGGYVPQSFDTFSAEFKAYTLNPFDKMFPDKIWQSRIIPLKPNEVVFKDFTNTALYSSVIYLPQATGIIIARLFNCNPFGLLYFGRLFNFLFFLITSYYAIKLMPFKKWLFVVLFMLPMSLSIHTSLSADVVLNALVFLFIAFVLDLSFNEKIEKISKKQILLLIALSFLIGMAKLVYVPVIFIVLLVPPSKFLNKKLRLLILAFVIFTGVGTALVQKSIIDTKYIPYSEYDKSFRGQTMLVKGVDINEQVKFIKDNPARTVKVFVKSFFIEFKPMTRSYIGALGWYNIYLPSWFVLLSYGVIFFIVVFSFSVGEMPLFSFLQRCYLGTIVFLLLVLIMLSQYLSWNVVGSEWVNPLQGRYFIPVFPLFFIMLINIFRVKVRQRFTKLREYFIVIFCLFSGIICLYTISTRSFILKDFTTNKWSINYSFADYYFDNEGEDKNDKIYIVSKFDTVASLSLPENRFITREKACNGNHSLKLTNQNPYGFTLKIFKGFANEKLDISCRSNGEGGYLVVQEYPNGLYYQTSKKIFLNDSLGWNLLTAQVILPYNISKDKELRIFVWYPDNDSIYIDDYNITCMGNE